MSKKGSKKASGEGSKSEHISEPTLQAVLLIDSYNLYFSPLSSNYPLCLFPVANEPILSYTLHFLRSAGVQELIIVGKHCSKELEGFIKNFMFTQKGPKLNIHSLFSETCDSLGTCLKHVHSSQLIHSDFVLLYGCVISNVDVLEIIKEHRTRTKKNPGSMMTMVFQRGAPQQRGRTQENDLALMISQNEKQLLFYQKTCYRNKLKFPLDKILSHNSVKIHYDIQETCLFICSPQVPQLFSENFDYQTIEDFINGILVDEELLSNQIHTHILDGRCYLSSASTPLAYHCINTDVMERWTYPYVPDSNLKLSPGDKYQYSRRNIYLGTCVTLERGSRLEVNVVIGKLCHIHAGAYITRSVLGDNVVVGENVKIEDSYIWSNVTIHDNCTITGCIIANDVIIKAQCNIGSSSFISRGLTIGPDVNLSPGTRLIQRIESIQTPDELSSSDSTPTLSSDYTPTQSSDYTPTQSSDCTPSLAQDIVNIGPDTMAMNIKLVDHTSGKPVQSEAVVWGMCKPTVDIVVRPETPEMGTVHVDPEESFYRDLLEIIRYGVRHSVAVENIQMEIKSRRHASVIPMEEIGIYVMQVVLEGPSQPVASSQELLNYVKTTITHLVQVFVNLIHEDEQQVELINAIETVAISNRMVSHIFQHILYHLYDKDIVSQEAILSWHSIEPVNYEMKKRTSLRKSVDTIVEWLQNADTDSSD